MLSPLLSHFHTISLPPAFPEIYLLISSLRILMVSYQLVSEPAIRVEKVVVAKPGLPGVEDNSTTR